MTTTSLRRAGASAAAALALLAAGCQDSPEPRPLPAVASTGAQHHVLPTSVDVLKPYDREGSRRGYGGAAAPVTPTGPATTTPDMKTPAMGMPTGPVDTPSPVNLSPSGAKTIEGLTSKLEGVGKPNKSHHELAFALGDALLKADGATGQVKRLGEVLQAVYPYVLASLAPGLEISAADAGTAKLEFETQLKALLGKDNADAMELQAFVFGSETLNGDNSFYKGLSALKAGDKKLFESATPDTVRRAAGDVARIVLPNATKGGFKELLPDELKAAADKPADK